MPLSNAGHFTASAHPSRRRATAARAPAVGPAAAGPRRHAVRPGTVILLYHRVAEPGCDPQLLSVTPRHFADHLEMLRRCTRPGSLDDLLREHQRGRMARRSVVVTFDDGYADNLHQALPLLERFDVPATVFVTSGVAGGAGASSTRAAAQDSGVPTPQAAPLVAPQPDEFWWDQLERIFLGTPRLPQALRIRLPGQELHVDLADSATLSPEGLRQVQRWNVLCEHDTSPRQRVYRELCRRLRPLPALQRDRILADLRSWAGLSTSAAHPTPRRLSDDELARLARSPLIEIGAHTCTHPVLAALEPAEQYAEIEGSRRDLEQRLGRAVRSFSYPYGTRGDYTSLTARLVAQAGFRCACANYPGLATPDVDIYGLPRLVVRDGEADALEELLHAFWAGS